MKALPIGIENFKEMIDHQYYYVDKTNFIKDVCNEKVALYTRPRRFHRNSGAVTTKKSHNAKEMY